MCDKKLSNGGEKQFNYLTGNSCLKNISSQTDSKQVEYTHRGKCTIRTNRKFAPKNQSIVL